MLARKWKRHFCAGKLWSSWIFFLEVSQTLSLPSRSTAFLQEPQECQCPRRGQVPPLPIKLPYEPTEENIPKIIEWLLDYYGSTAFNTCEHQGLPLMTGEPPLRLYVDPNAKPYAVHKPATVPIHWQERVRSDLERDVRHGNQLMRITPNRLIKRVSDQTESRTQWEPVKDSTLKQNTKMNDNVQSLDS